MITVCSKAQTQNLPAEDGKHCKQQESLLSEVNVTYSLPFSVFLNLGRTPLTMYHHIAGPVSRRNNENKKLTQTCAPTLRGIRTDDCRRLHTPLTGLPLLTATSAKIKIADFLSRK